MAAQALPVQSTELQRHVVAAAAVLIKHPLVKELLLLVVVQAAKTQESMP